MRSERVFLHLRNLASRNFQTYRPARGQWDAGWKIYNVIAIGTPRTHSAIYGKHFELGPVPVTQSPHYQFVLHHLGFEGGNAQNYADYVSKQYSLSGEETRAKIQAFRKLIDDFSTLTAPMPIAVKIVDKKILIADGFHRASIASVLSGQFTIRCHIVAPGGRLTHK